jgi:hypothetical protein
VDAKYTPFDKPAHRACERLSSDTRSGYFLGNWLNMKLRDLPLP